MLTPSQAAAAASIASGATHSVAAEVAGCHRVTVTKWAAHHPAFVAEVNRLRAEAAAEAVARIARLTDLALGAVQKALEDGNLDAAFRWFKLISPQSSVPRVYGPTDSASVVEQVRGAMKPPALEMLDSVDQRSTEEAERAIAFRLQE